MFLPASVDRLARADLRISQHQALADQAVTADIRDRHLDLVVFWGEERAVALATQVAA